MGGTPEFYKELAEALEACGTDEERGRVFLEIHEKHGVDADEVNRETFDTWAVRIQCTPPELEAEMDTTSFLVTINAQELQALIISQSDYGRQLLQSDEFSRLRDMLGQLMRRLGRGAENVLPVLEELYDKYNDEITAMADAAQREIEEVDDAGV